jgi:hypothetical protein
MSIRLGAVAIALAAIAACDDDCRRTVADYCRRHECSSYEERRAEYASTEIRCLRPPVSVGEQVMVWSCGELRAIQWSDGYNGRTELYDSSGRLISANVAGDTPDDDGCFDYTYGFDLSACRPPADARCLAPASEAVLRGT